MANHVSGPWPAYGGVNDFSPTAQLKLCNALAGGCQEALGTSANADQTLTITGNSGELLAAA